MAHFEVGKKVIALVSHPDGDFKKYDIFPLIGIRVSMCRCDGIELNVGIINNLGGWVCNECGMQGESKDGMIWQDSKDFAPYDDSLSELTVEHILNEQTVTT